MSKKVMSIVAIAALALCTLAPDSEGGIFRRCRRPARGRHCARTSQRHCCQPARSCCSSCGSYGTKTVCPLYAYAKHKDANGDIYWSFYAKICDGMNTSYGTVDGAVDLPTGGDCPPPGDTSKCFFLNWYRSDNAMLAFACSNPNGGPQHLGPGFTKLSKCPDKDNEELSTGASQIDRTFVSFNKPLATGSTRLCRAVLYRVHFTPSDASLPGNAIDFAIGYEIDVMDIPQPTMVESVPDAKVQRIQNTDVVNICRTIGTANWQYQVPTLPN